MADVLKRFEHFDRAVATRSRDPLVTIQMHGKRIFINESAYRAMNEPPHIELYYDRERRIVGLEAARRSTPTGYEPRRDSSGGYYIAGGLFTKYMQIDTAIARRYAPDVEDSVLLVHLDGPSAIVTGLRGRRPPQERRTAADETDYAVIVEHVEASYKAYVPDLPGCTASGRTYDETVTRISGAITNHVRSVRERGELVPHPTTRAITVTVKIKEQ